MTKRQHIDARRAAKMAGAGMTPREIAAVLGIKQILVGNSIYNAAKEGQTFSGSNYWSNHAI